MKNDEYSQLIEVSSANDPTLLRPPPVHSSPYGSTSSYGGPMSSSKVHQLVPIGQDQILEINGEHHSKAHRPIVLITILQLLGLLLSLGILAAAAYGVFTSYKSYKKWKDTIIADYFLFQLAGSIIQALNSLHGTFSFLFRSAKCLEIYGRTSTGTLLWEVIQTVALIVYSVNATDLTPAEKQERNTAIILVVVGWLPFIIGIIARMLRYHLLTWNMYTLFTLLDNWLLEPTEPEHPHCKPHKFKTIERGSCGCCYCCCICCCCCPSQSNQSYYFCPNCGEEWVRT